MNRTEKIALAFRGKYKEVSVGARGIERMARNPECRRLFALTIAGISSRLAAEVAYRETIPEEQSPFAIRTGVQFETRLFGTKGEEIIRLYLEAGRLQPGEGSVAGVKDSLPWRCEKNDPGRVEESLVFLGKKIDGDPAAPSLILQPRIPISIGGIPRVIEPDALFASPRDRFYRPVEIKSYSDREGKTSSSDLRNACRQTAVTVIALRQFVYARGVDPELIEASGDLILRKAGYFSARLRPMTLKSEVATIQRLLDSVPGRLEETKEVLSRVGARTLDTKKALDALHTNYVDGCKDHCALAIHCREEARACHDPALLGSKIREVLLAAGNLERVLQLLRGTGDPPKNEAEMSLAHQLQNAYAAYREVSGFHD